LVVVLSNGNEINVGEIMPMELASQIKVITNGGGTSQSVLDTLASLQTQINNLIPSQTGNSGKYLTTNGTTTSWGSIAGGGLSYQGTWNATTNTPTLASSTGVNGYYYIVGTAGSTNLDGISDWQIGDWLLFNGTVWQKIDQSELVTSITSADASIVVTTTGSTVDLSVSQTSPASVLVEQVRNTTGATLTKGTAVYISGATGQIPTVSKALATGDSTSAQTLGLITSNLSNNSNGYVTIIGLVSNLDTSAYTDGAQLYLSPTTAGTLTATKPYAPQHLVYMAVVAHAHPTQGKLLVKVQNGYELDELHNVSAQSPVTGQTIVYNSSTSLWEKNTVSLTAGINGTLPVANGGTGVTTSTGSGNTVLSTSPTLVTPILGTPTSATLTNATGLPLTTGVTGTLPVANGGTGTATPSIVAGTNITVTGSWPNQTIASSGGSLFFPFYKADGTSDTISLVSGTSLPFFNSSGVAKNIALTT
jgi:hypothetical protein